MDKEEEMGEVEETSVLEARLLEMCEPVVDRAYSDKTDHEELLYTLHGKHPEFRVKDYIAS